MNRLPEPTDDLAASDWESATLSRAMARIENLPPLPAEAEDFGWESGVLEKLRLRLGEVE
jgi:hypothetical protein